MSLQALMIIGVIIVILILVVTLISVNRAYAFRHTIDAKPIEMIKKNSNKTE